VNVAKELKKGHDVIMAQVMLIQEIPMNQKTISPELKDVLMQYKNVFEEPKDLPPCRLFDHQIVLKPNSTPINQRPYKYSYY
jgi:hypothetical protein